MAEGCLPVSANVSMSICGEFMCLFVTLSSALITSVMHSTFCAVTSRSRVLLRLQPSLCLPRLLKCENIFCSKQTY